jgi:hypothetical protein
MKVSVETDEVRFELHAQQVLHSVWPIILPQTSIQNLVTVFSVVSEIKMYMGRARHINAL